MYLQDETFFSISVALHELTFLQWKFIYPRIAGQQKLILKYKNKSKNV